MQGLIANLTANDLGSTVSVAVIVSLLLMLGRMRQQAGLPLMVPMRTNLADVAAAIVAKLTRKQMFQVVVLAIICGTIAVVMIAVCWV